MIQALFLAAAVAIPDNTPMPENGASDAAQPGQLLTVADLKKLAGTTWEAKWKFKGTEYHLRDITIRKYSRGNGVSLSWTDGSGKGRVRYRGGSISPDDFEYAFGLMLVMSIGDGYSACIMGEGEYLIFVTGKAAPGKRGLGAPGPSPMLSATVRANTRPSPETHQLKLSVKGKYAENAEQIDFMGETPKEGLDGARASLRESIELAVELRRAEQKASEEEPAAQAEPSR